MRNEEKKQTRRLFWGGVLLLAIFSAGCSATIQKNRARGLSPEEAAPLLTIQAAKQIQAAKMTKSAKTPVEMERVADRLAVGGDWMGAVYQYGRVLAGAGKEQKARVRLKTAWVLLQNRQFAPAAKAFEVLTKTQGSIPAVWLGLGLARLSAGDLPRARQALEKSLSMDGRLWKAHNALGIISNQERNPAQAVKSFSAALAQGARRSEIFNNRGLAYMLLGRGNLAESDFRKAIRLKPGFALPHNNLALLLARAGRFDEAYRSFSRGSGPAQAHNNLGCILAWRGNLEKAADHFDQALGRMPAYYTKAGDHLSRVKSPQPPVVNLGALGAASGQRAFHPAPKSEYTRPRDVKIELRRRPAPAPQGEAKPASVHPDGAFQPISYQGVSARPVPVVNASFSPRPVVRGTKDPGKERGRSRSQHLIGPGARTWRLGSTSMGGPNLLARPD